MGGAESDSSGVSQDIHGAMLSWMEDSKVDGALSLGHPGTGKTAMFKILAARYNIPGITFDIGAMKNSLVGKSGEQFRYATKVIDAISRKNCLILATCNSIDKLSVALRRRFKKGIFFYDLPDEDGRKVIADQYIKKYGLDAGSFDNVDMTDWTGAEIRNCAEQAYDLKITPVEAAKYIIPIAVSARKSIDDLRETCSGKYLSAQYSGIYYASVTGGKVPVKLSRKTSI